MNKTASAVDAHLVGAHPDGWLRDGQEALDATDGNFC